MVALPSWRGAVRIADKAVHGKARGALFSAADAPTSFVVVVVEQRLRSS